MSALQKKLNGFLSPAYGHPNQWEVTGFDKSKTDLPLSTWKETLGQDGIEITCKYDEHHQVTAQFHRTPSERMWIGTNRRHRGLKDDTAATEKWYEFLSLFGIQKNVLQDKKPVSVDFYSDCSVVIRQRKE